MSDNLVEIKNAVGQVVEVVDDDFEPTSIIRLSDGHNAAWDNTNTSDGKALHKGDNVVLDFTYDPTYEGHLESWNDGEPAEATRVVLAS